MLLSSTSEGSFISLEDVELFLLEPLVDVRREIRVALMSQGLKNVLDFDKTSDLVEMLRDQTPDVLVADADVPPLELSKFIRTVRQCQSPMDPFFPIIFMSWRTDIDLVRSMALAGVDDILAKPISTGIILERVVHLVHKRKRFVVTSEYVGPDRRSEERGQADPALIAVPNKLGQKAVGNFDEIGYWGQVEAARANVLNRRISSYGERLHLLANMLQPLMLNGTFYEDANAGHQLAEMVRLSNRLVKQVRQTKYAQTAELGSQLFEVADRLVKQRQKMAPKDIQLLKPMAQAVHRAVNPDLDEDALALNIAERVANYKKARR